MDFRGTFFVNSPRFDRGTHYMTLGQVLDLQSRGHEIGGHTLDHPHLPTLLPNAQRIEICNDRASLLAQGLDVRHFAYPFGEANDDTEAAAQFCNYDSARGVGDLTDADGGRIGAENYIPPDPFKIRRRLVDHRHEHPRGPAGAGAHGRADRRLGHHQHAPHLRHVRSE